MRQERYDLLAKSFFAGLLLLASTAFQAAYAAGQPVSSPSVLYPPEGNFTKGCINTSNVATPKQDWTAWDGASAPSLTNQEFLATGRFYLEGNSTIPADKPTARRIFSYIAKSGASMSERAKIELARMSLLEHPIYDYIPQIRQWGNEIKPKYPREANRLLGELEEIQENHEAAATYFREALKEGDAPSAFDLAKLIRSNSITAKGNENPDQLIKLGQNIFLSNLGKGDCSSLYAFGMLYTRSRAVERNEDAAVQWFEASIKGQNDRASMMRAAELYKAGVGISRNMPRAIQLWQQAAAKGSARAMSLLGEMYLKGDGVMADPEKAVVWYEKAAKHNHVKSIETLANLYSDPESTLRNNDKAFYWLSIAAKHPDVDPGLWVKLGDAYSYGRGVEKDHNTAFNWYDKAAKAGNTDGIFRLGEAYRYGRGVEQDIKRSLRFYRLAANLGNDDAIMLMAENYEKGIGVPLDPGKQRRWLERGVSAGNASAQLELSKLLLSLPEQQDKAEAVSLIRKAAESGDKRSMVELSMLYEQGALLEKSNDLARSWRERALLPGEKKPDAMLALANAFIEGRVPGRTAKDAIPLLEKAISNHNFSKAAFALGQLYHRGGTGVEPDLDKAREYYKMAALDNHAKSIEKLAETFLTQKPLTDAQLRSAADYLEQASELGNPEAMRELGLLYVAGKGRPLDAKKGAFWLKRAANLGDLSASSELGELYLNGIGVDKDPQEAVRYLTIAAEQGSPSAMRKLGRLYARGGSVESDPKNFIHWMNKSAEAGDIAAMLEMANAYAAGFGVQESQERAVYWLEKAAGLGNEDARQQLAIIEKKKVE